MKLRLGIAASLVVFTAAGVPAQWLRYPDPRVPRTADGQPDLKAPPPRLPDGRIDLSGIWHSDAKTTVGGGPVGQTSGEDPAIRLQTEDGTPFPLLPATEAQYKERLRRSDHNPSSRCLPHTIVDRYLAPSPFKFVHAPGLTLILFEQYVDFRQVFTDGRPFPDDMQPAWFGYSIGRWEGDEFVIETAGFNTQGWLGLDNAPLTHSESLRTTERFRRPTTGTLQVQVTISDPTQFSRPWRTQTINFRLLGDSELVEYVCDNDRTLKPTPN